MSLSKEKDEIWTRGRSTSLWNIGSYGIHADPNVPLDATVWHRIGVFHLKQKFKSIFPLAGFPSNYDPRQEQADDISTLPTQGYFEVYSFFVYGTIILSDKKAPLRNVLTKL